MPAMAVQAHYWQKRRAFIMGIVITGIVFSIFQTLLFLNSGSKQDLPLAGSSSRSCSITSSTALLGLPGECESRVS